MFNFDLVWVAFAVPLLHLLCKLRDGLKINCDAFLLILLFVALSSHFLEVCVFCSKCNSLRQFHAVSTGIASSTWTCRFCCCCSGCTSCQTSISSSLFFILTWVVISMTICFCNRYDRVRTGRLCALVLVAHMLFGWQLREAWIAGSPSHCHDFCFEAPPTVPSKLARFCCCSMLFLLVWRRHDSNFPTFLAHGSCLAGRSLLQS